MRHNMKGIGQFVFSALAVQNPATVADVVATCQRLDKLQSIRLHNNSLAPAYLANDELRTIIRAIIREELGNQPSLCSASVRRSAPTPFVK